MKPLTQKPPADPNAPTPARMASAEMQDLASPTHRDAWVAAVDAFIRTVPMQGRRAQARHTAQDGAQEEARQDGAETVRAQRDALLLNLARFQYASVPAYARYCDSLQQPATLWSCIEDVPALPTTAFRAGTIASFPLDEAVQTFLTSGTTQKAGGMHASSEGATQGDTGHTRQAAGRHGRYQADDHENDAAAHALMPEQATPLGGRRGMHAFRDLSLYHLAAERMASNALFGSCARVQAALQHPSAACAGDGDGDGAAAGNRADATWIDWKILLLTPDAIEAPHSSLAHMLALFCERFSSTPGVSCFRQGQVDVKALRQGIADARTEARPVALLGTSFGFVFAEEALQAAALDGADTALPEGSLVMQTGGFKGRTRTHSAAEMRVLIARRYAVSQPQILAEYGMTELSSQAYEQVDAACIRMVDAYAAVSAETTQQTPGERTMRDVPPAYRFPPWVRAVVCDPVTLGPVPQGSVGLLRIDDLANVDSVACILTSDMARSSARGIELLGRAQGSVLRGCSLQAEEARVP